jgi:hypothetical protein
LHNKELHNINYLQNIIRMVKSRMIRWAGHVARLGEKNACRVSQGPVDGGVKLKTHLHLLPTLLMP